MHATPRKKDPRYDHRAERASIALTLHRDDGTSTDVELHLGPDEVELHWAQLDRLIDRRGKHLSGELP